MEAYNGRVLSLLRSASDFVHPYIEQVPYVQLMAPLVGSHFPRTI